MPISTTHNSRSHRPGKRETRKAEIIEIIRAQSPIRIEDLADRLGVSLMTIYRDIADLERTELVAKDHGEVSATASTLVESSSRLRTMANVATKRRLAAAALALIPRGGSLLLDDSTTNLQLFPELEERSPLTVITNTRFIAKETAALPGLSLISTGGEYIPWADGYFGPITVNAISALQTDVCIMSSSAVRAGNCYHPDARVAETKRAMLNSAITSILLVDSTKFFRTALHKVCPVEVFSVVITDAGTPTAVIKDLEDRGVRVIVV